MSAKQVPVKRDSFRRDDRQPSLFDKGEATRAPGRWTVFFKAPGKPFHAEQCADLDACYRHIDQAEPEYEFVIIGPKGGAYRWSDESLLDLLWPQKRKTENLPEQS